MPTYRSISWTMLGGLLLAVAVMIIGLIAAAVSGAHASTVLPLDRILAALGRGQANAILDLGILLLFATPLIGVLVALAGFLRERDGTFTLITVVLLIFLLIGFAVALR